MDDFLVEALNVRGVGAKWPAVVKNGATTKTVRILEGVEKFQKLFFNYLSVWLAQKIKYDLEKF